MFATLNPLTNTSYNPVITRFIDHVFERPYCSNGKSPATDDYTCWKTSKREALTLPIIQFNGPRQSNYLWFDIDKPREQFPWVDDPTIPVPNIVSVNPANGHYHVAYELVKPIYLTGPNAVFFERDSKAVWFFKATRQALGQRLGADPGFTHHLGKNPLHPSWRTFTPRLQPYTLTELSHGLDFRETKTGDKKREHPPEGRRHTLFELGRKWAYRAKARFDRLSEFLDAIEDKLHRVYDSFENIGHRVYNRRHLRELAEYIGIWTWEHEVGGGERVALPLEVETARQRAAALKTNETRSASTRSKITTAISQLRDLGERMTKAAVARLAGIDRRTVHRHWLALSERSASLSASVTSQLAFSLAIPGNPMCDSGCPTFSVIDEQPVEDLIDEPPEEAKVDYQDLPTDPIKRIIETIKLGRQGISLQNAPWSLYRLSQRAMALWKNPPIEDDIPDIPVETPERNSIFV